MRKWIWSAFPLALFVSLLNTVVIVVYLVPHHMPPNEHGVAAHGQTLLPMVKYEKSQESSSPSENKYPVLHLQENQQSIMPQVGVFKSAKNKASNAQLEEEFQGHSYMKHILQFDGDSMLMAGKPPTNPVELVIGIPTVKRASKDYLTSTLKQLVEYLNENEKKDCHIIIYSAELDVTKNKQLVERIKKQFKDELESGLIQVIKPDAKFYPQFDKLPVLWKDSPERIKWRSKQCVDYALLFTYSRNLGKYYLQLEDDVLVTKGYFSEIKQFIEARGTSKWSNLQFGTGGFIAMLFRSSALTRLAMFVKLYYWLYPVDILFRHYNDIYLYGNSALDIYKPPLFRHLGAESSLKGQKRKIELEAKGKNQINHRQYKDASNPPALVTTNIDVFGNYAIEGPYREKNLWYFWGRNMEVSCFVLVQFKKEVTLTHVVIDSGSLFAPEDVIGDGKLQTTGIGKDGDCDVQSYSLLNSTRTNGKIEASSNNSNGIPGVKCLLFTITKLTYKNKQARWLIIREIAVWAKQT